MIACFDTNIYIDELTGKMPIEQLQQWRSRYLSRLCPVVYHELLRGARKPAPIYDIRDHTIALAPPTFLIGGNAAMILREKTGKFGIGDDYHHLQNDVLIALTARANGALLITADGHFEKLAEWIPFHFQIHIADSRPRP